MSSRATYSALASADAGEPHRPTLEVCFRGHRNSVHCVDFQPSHATTPAPPRILSSSADGAVMLWDGKATVRALRFVGHRGPVLGCAFSPRAQMVGSCGHDGYARLWIPDLRRTSTTYPPRGVVEEDRNVCSWKAHGGSARAIAFGQDGSDHLYTAGDDKCVKCWDMNYVAGTGGGNRFVGSFSATPSGTAGHTNWVRCVVTQSATTSANFFHYIASGGDDKCVFVWDIRTYRPAHTFSEPTASVYSVRFHPDGYCLASADASGTINLFDLRQSSSALGGQRFGLIQRYTHAHSGAVQDVSFSPDGGWLLSAGEDGVARLWDIKEGHLYCSVQAHEGPVRACRFSSDGRYFATGGKDGVVMCWRSGLPSAMARAQPAQTPEASAYVEDNVVTRLGSAHARTCARATFQHTDPAREAQDRLLLRSVAPAHPPHHDLPPRTPPRGVGVPEKLPPLGPSQSETATPAARAGGEEPAGGRSRSFSRSEERYSHITPHGSNGGDPAASASAAAEMDAGKPQGREDGGPGLPPLSPPGATTETTRLDNVERAVAALAEYMQEQYDSRDAAVEAMRMEIENGERRHQAELTTLKEMVQALVEQQTMLVQQLSARTATASLSVTPPAMVVADPPTSNHGNVKA